jgi:hypothetical protein
MDDWKPDSQQQVNVKEKYGTAAGISDIYFWVVPAKVDGTWQSRLTVRGKTVDYVFALNQAFQFASGTASVNGRSVPIANARLNGQRVTFDFTAELDGAPTKHAFTGTVVGGTMTGTTDLSAPRLQARLDWTAKQTR